MSVIEALLRVLGIRNKGFKVTDKQLKDSQKSQGAAEPNFSFANG